MCTQGNLSVSAYFTKFRGLWDELTSLIQTPKCVCVNVLMVHPEFKMRMIVYKLTQILMGLSDKYTDVRGQILRMSPLSSIIKAISMLTQEES